MLDIPKDWDFLDRVLVYCCVLLWLLCFGFLSWRVNWSDPKTNERKEYIIEAIYEI